MKRIFMSLLAILTLCTLARATNGKDSSGNLPSDITDTNICKEWTYTTATWNGTGDVIPFYDDCQTNVHFTMNSVGSNDYETFIFEFWDANGSYVTCVGQNNIWGGGDVNPPVLTKQPCTYPFPPTGDVVLSMAKIDDNNIRVYVDYPEGSQDLIWNLHYDYGTPTITYVHMGGQNCSYTISKIDFTEVDIADKTVIKFYDTDETFENWNLNKNTDGLNSNLTVDEFAILDGYETTVNLTLESVGTADFHTFAFEIYDAVGKYTTCLGNNNYWGDYTYAKIVPNIYADVTGEYTVSVAKIDDNIIRFHVVLPTGTTTMWNETSSSYEYDVTLPESFTMYADYSASGGNSVATSFHMGGESCSYTINSITFTAIDETDDDYEFPTEEIIDTDTDYTENGKGGWSIDATAYEWSANLTGLIALKDNTQTNVYFTMNSVGVQKAQDNTFVFETSLNGIYMSATGNNNLWGNDAEAKYPNYFVDPATSDYVLSVAKVNDNTIRVYVQTPEGVEDYIWEQTFTSTEDISTFYMGGKYCDYTITKITFTTINECNTAVSSKNVYSGLINTDTDFEPAVNLYASYGFSPAISPITFPITKGTTTSVNFTAQPFLLIADNWENFNFETIATTSADGINFRADSYCTYTYTYNSGSAVNTPTNVITNSWGNEESDWASYREMCKTNPYLTLTASITGNNTLEFNVYWYANEERNTEAVAWETYVVTYPNGVPDDLTFHIGAESSIMTLTSVKFEKIEPVVVTVINGNSSPTENPFVNCTKSELGTATITLNYEYKAIDETATITVTANYEGSEGEALTKTITVTDPANSDGTIVLKESDILTALFGEEYTDDPAVRLRDLTLLTFEGAFGSGITLTEATTDYKSDETFDVDVDTTFGEEGENEWEIRTIGVTELEKSGEISIKDAYQTNIEYELDKVSATYGAMSVEIIDENGNSVVLYGTGFFTQSTTTGNAPAVSSSVTTGSLITPSTGEATFAIAKVGGNTIEAVFTYEEETSVTFTITYPSSYDDVKSFYIGGSNCAYTVNAVTFTVIENTITIIDTENGVENPFSEAEDDDMDSAVIHVYYEYSAIDSKDATITITAYYEGYINDSGTLRETTLNLTKDLSVADKISNNETGYFNLSQDEIFTALELVTTSLEPVKTYDNTEISPTLKDFTLLTLTGKNGLLLTNYQTSYESTVNNYATLDLIGNEASVFDGLSSTEIGTATVELTLGNMGVIESVELTVTATYGDETAELTGTITIEGLVTASGVKVGSFTMAEIETALTADPTVTDFDWSKVTALTLSVGAESDYQYVQLRGASVTSYIISSNKEYTDGWAINCSGSDGNLTGKIAILSGQQTNIVFEMTSVGTQDQDDTFSLTVGEMLCEGNNAISGTANAIRYPNYNIDPVVGEYTLSIANVNGTYRVYVATPESIEDFVWEGTLASDASTFTMGGTWCSYTISEITFTTIDECATAIENMTPYATGLIETATTFSPVINVYGSYGFNSDGSGVTFPVTEGYTTSVNVTMRPFTRVNATPAVSDNYVIETIATESADGVTMLLGKVSTTSLVESSAVNTPTIAYSPSWENLSSEEIIAMCEAHTDLTIDASIVDEKTVTFVVSWNDDNDAETPVSTYTYTLTYPEGVPEKLEFQIGADGAITTLTSVVFNEIIIEDEGNDDGEEKKDEGTTGGTTGGNDDDTTGGTGSGEDEDEGSTAIANVSVPVLEVARYNLLGQRIIAPQRGINIIVYSDGSTKKVLVK